MTKRRVQGGAATSERRRRDGVSGKSHLRGLSSLLKIFPPCLGDANQRTVCIGSFPRARVSRASHAWRVRAVRAERILAVFLLSVTSDIPRVRTYLTKKPSRFVHALSARPHNRVGGRGWSLYADGMECIFLFFLLIVLGFCLVGVGASTTR